MQPWQLKAVRDGAKSFLPMQGVLRKIARTIRPYTTNPANDAWLFSNVLMQVRLLQDLGIDIPGRQVVELGTGWNPLLPLVYARCGAARVVTVDQERLLDTRTVRYALQFLHTEDRQLQTLQGLRPSPHGALPPENLSRDELLKAERIDYRAPYDIRDLDTASADLLVSRDVLEHVPEKTLRSLAAGWHRMLKDGGVMCHTIDMSDHWEHADKSISRVNFLQYDGPAWALAGLNVQNFQNRLRRYEFIEIFRNAGFEILVATGEPDPKALAAVKAMRVCPRYADVPARELAVLDTTIVARKRPAQ